MVSRPVIWRINVTPRWQEVASRMDVSYFISSAGDMQVYTTSGQALVDGSVHLLSHTASASVTASTTYDPASTCGSTELC